MLHKRYKAKLFKASTQDNVVCNSSETELSRYEELWAAVIKSAILDKDWLFFTSKGFMSLVSHLNITPIAIISNLPKEAQKIIGERNS
jgi:hypothetical protein